MAFLKAIIWGTLKRLIHAQFPDISSLSTRELADWVAQPETNPPLLLDARTPEEYEVSHLQQAHLPPIDLRELSRWAGITETTPIVTYCSVGYRSAKLALQLQALGYKQVFNLEGSLFEWVNQGYPVYHKEQVVQAVHPFNQYWGLLLNPEIPQVLPKTE